MARSRSFDLQLCLLVIVSVGIAGFAQPGASRVARAVPDVARPLPLTAVRLTGGPLKHAQDLDAKYLLELEPDRMLAYYRMRAGLEAKGQPYAGWDGDGRNLTGHIAGHYLSGVSLMYAATGDPRFKQRADYIADELKIVQDKHGDGYLSALAGGRKAFGELANGVIRSASFDLNGEWSPWYTLHKTFAGLRDAYRYTGNKTALDVEARFAAWADGILSKLTDDQIQRMLNTEFGGMNEILVDLFADTGDKRWLSLSYRFEHRAVLDPLKRGEDNLAGLHGNTQVPKLIGSAARYALTGDKADGDAARFFWQRVAHHHTFPTGGHGKDEYFREPGKLSNITDGRTSESCNIYNMLKLTRRLFALQPDIAYAEFHERALFNHVLGSIDPENGAVCYMVPVGRSARKEYQDMTRSFTCCVGSGMESHALHALGIYYEGHPTAQNTRGGDPARSGERLWVNLYAPSTAQWDTAGVQVSMATDFPEGESASLELTTRAPRSLTLALRRPLWAAAGFAVTVNGEAVKNLPAPGSYVELTRVWRTGDRVSVVLPKALRLEEFPDNRQRVAVMWGPLVLAGDLGPEPPRGQGQQQAPLPAPSEAPVLVASGRTVSAWLKALPDKAGTFRTAGAARDFAGGSRDLELVPFYRLHRRTYSAAWDLYTPDEYDKRTAAIAAERDRQRKLESATVSYVAAAGPDAEKPFNQQGEGSSIVRVEGRAGRRAGSWFSYDLPIDAARTLALVVTYHADQRRARSFDILVDGTRVGQQSIPESSEPRFFEVTYPIAADLTRGKEKITVRFQAASGSEVPGVFGVRVVRAEDVR
jgi:DUF1680 family protein